MSTGETYILQPSLRLGCLDILGSSASTHGLGEARGGAPSGENDKTGNSLHLTILEWLYLQTFFALGGPYNRFLALRLGLHGGIFICAPGNTHERAPARA